MNIYHFAISAPDYPSPPFESYDDAEPFDDSMVHRCMQRGEWFVAKLVGRDIEPATPWMLTGLRASEHTSEDAAMRVENIEDPFGCVTVMFVDGSTARLHVSRFADHERAVVIESDTIVRASRYAFD